MEGGNGGESEALEGRFTDFLLSKKTKENMGVSERTHYTLHITPFFVVLIRY